MWCKRFSGETVCGGEEEGVRHVGGWGPARRRRRRRTGRPQGVVRKDEDDGDGGEGGGKKRKGTSSFQQREAGRARVPQKTQRADAQSVSAHTLPTGYRTAVWEAKASYTAAIKKSVFFGGAVGSGEGEEEKR